MLILTENAELNAAIISTGLQSFVQIAKKLGWIYDYVGGSMKSKLALREHTHRRRGVESSFSIYGQSLT